jgi:aspartate racemase
MAPDNLAGKQLTLGVLGGLGPEATLHFLARVVALTPIERDQDHLHVIVDINPKVPDRNAAIAGTGPSSGPALAAMAARLAQAGADFLAMPCNTAHAYEAEIGAATPLPLISIVTASCDALQRAFPAATTIGMLATQGCLDAGLYAAELSRRGLRLLTLEAEDQLACSRLIYEIKRDSSGTAVRAEAKRVGERLIARGAQVVLAACTEIPLVIKAGDLSRPLLDSVEVLAQRCVAYALEGLPRA